MASAEQPLKKRKLYESLPEPPPPQQPPPLAQLPKSLHQSFAAPPLSQEEILRRRRNREEIRSVYDCYKQIKFCLSQKDPRFMPDLEQAYLSLITASRGCTSVQRIVADFIPRYASYCPTALEAAVKVTINMHNWSLAVINRGEDADGVAFGTAKACVFGLADICHTASSQAPTSSVIQGICSAVFYNVLTFLISSFEGKDIFQIVDKEALKIQDSTEFFSKLKERFSDEDESALVKLSKFRALCLLRIFFCCPGNSLAACFEFFDSAAPEGAQKEGRHFLHQVTSTFNIDNVAHCLNNSLNESKSLMEGIDLVSKDEVSSPVLRNCLLGLVLGKDPSLRKWLFSKYNKLCKSASSEVLSEAISVLEGIFESFTDLVKVEDSQVDSDKDDSDSSKYINKQYLVPGMNQHENSYEVSGRDCTSKVHDGSYNDDLADKISSQYLKHHRSLVTLESDPSNASSSYDSSGSKLVNFDTGEQGDLSRCRSSTPRDILNIQLPSPISRKPFDFRTNSFERRNHFGQIEKNQVLPTLMSSGGVVNSTFESPRCHQTVPHPCTSDQAFWYSDGDSAAMDVFSASKQLWLGSLGPDASEALVRFQFEKFGPIEHFLYFPSKGFALVEYRYIMDAINAREVMRGHSPWGACLRIKFLDKGMGTRGIVNGVAVGSSCQVYIGNIWSQWAKDEILQDLIKVFYKGPRMVTDLTGEGALLLEFETPEEAASVIAHLRQQRKVKNHPLQSNVAPATGTRLIDLSRSGPAYIHGDFRSNKLGNNIVESPHGQTVLESPTDGYSMRMSRLASLLSSLRSKYNITYNSNYIDNQMSADGMRDEDRLPTSTLWINIPNVSPPFLTDDELMAICNLAIGSVGSVIRFTRANMQMGACWFVECSSLDAAHALLKNLRVCPMNLFQIEFSQSGKLQAAPFTTKPESSATELPIPRLNPENHGTTIQSGHAFQSNWTAFGCAGTQEAGARKIDTYDNTMVVNSLNGGGHVVSGTTEQMWMYNKPEAVVHSAPGNIPCMPTPYQGPIMPPPQPFPSTPFMRPVYFPLNSSWDAHSLGHHQPLNPVSPGVIPNNPHSNSVPAPFLPASVTPLAQVQGSSLQHSNQMFPLPVVPPPIASLPPPQPDMPPPLPPSPPPLPQHQPPLVPPPPSSPPPLPPPPPVESSHLESSGQSLHYQWQGALSKSGVHYCTIYAHRVDSDACKYSNAISEPAEWPAKLDMTKRTDFRHVMATFSGTPPHKREVCRLFPSSEGDHKGFQDFISYLKQRECAGVIKIPAAKSMWARLLFILPYSMDACSMLSIAPNPSDCLIALILPKETNFEWV